jgi:cytochrome c oxidase assembly protein subunit 15
MDRITHRYRKLVFFTWFLTLDLILFGAFVRLTDSGLGCPDWPGCYGSASPVGAINHISAAHQDMPYGPVALSKAWIEMVHRYAGSILGMLIIAIVYMAFRYRARLGRSPALAGWILGAVCLQGAFGAWTVTHRLMPAVVTTHLVLGIGLLALMTWLAARERPYPPVPDTALRWRPWMVAGLALVFLQITLGGWVSTNYAALACMDFPTCHGEWLPPMDFAGGFSIFRALGESASGEIISQDALTAIQWVHRNFAFAVFIYLFILGWKMRREVALRGPATLLLALLCAQVVTGLSTIFFQWPLLIAVLHSGGAACLVLASVTLLVRLTPVRALTAAAPGFVNGIPRGLVK